MNHAEVKKCLADYLEGDLALEHRAAVDAHLDSCSECAREVAEMQQTIRLLRLMPEPETPPMIAANVMRRIRAGETRPGWLRQLLGGLGSIFEPSFTLPASAIAAAALVVMLAQGPGGLAGIGERGFDALFASGDDATIAGAERTNSANLIGADAIDAPPLAASAISSFAASPRRSNADTEARLGSRRNAARPRAGNDSVASRRRITLDFDVLAKPQPRTVFSDPALATALDRALLPDSYLASGQGQGALPARSASRLRASAPGAVNVSQTMQAGEALSNSTGGGDPRDAWLVKGLESPVEFARFLASKTLAEQELWIARLGDRADSRGLLGELVLALQESGDEAAAWLAKDFLAQAGRRDLGGSEVPASR